MEMHREETVPRVVAANLLEGDSFHPTSPSSIPSGRMLLQNDSQRLDLFGEVIAIRIIFVLHILVTRPLSFTRRRDWPR